MIGIFGAIKEVFGFASTLTNAKQRRERYELMLDKKASKAIEAGEKFILGYDSFMAGNVTKKQWKYLYRKYRKIFFENN